MQIKELNQHCGECELIEHCGNAFGYCICTDERFQEMSEEQYKKLAEQAEFKEFKKCEGCFEECMGCENEEEEREYRSKQIADFVEKAITETVKDKYSIQGKKVKNK